MAYQKLLFGRKHLTKQRAALELSFASVLWGFGFIAAVWALNSYTPAETLFWRFFIATILGELIFLLVKFRRKISMDITETKTQLILALPAGLLLGGMLLLQTIGLKYTTATKSGFITCLYIILVPLFNFVFFKNKIGWNSLIFVTLAMTGTYFLVGGPIESINTGDLWTLACAVLAAFHIIYIGRVSKKITNGFRFNNFQSFWCLLASIPFVLFQSKIFVLPTIPLATWGLICLGAGSSVIAFYLQIRAQKILDDTTASMLFLLESPMAAIFGFLILSERLSTIQAAGALLILISAALQVLNSPKPK